MAVDVIGVTRWGRTIELDDEAWDESFDLVLRHFFNLVRVAGRDMAEHGRGSIVAIASVSGLRSAPLHGAYGAAKAALLSLVRTLAMELGGNGVRVNAVAPGAVLTPRVEAMMSEDRRAASAANIPLGRFATPDDIARAVRVPRVRSRVVHHRPDARRRRRRDRAVPALAPRLSTHVQEPDVYRSLS